MPTSEAIGISRVFASSRYFIRLEATFLFCLTVLIAQLVLYLLHPVNPLTGGDADWYGWWDQSKYLESADALRRFDLSPGKHWYPLGYSFLGAAGGWVFPGDPFLLVNAILLAVYCFCFIRFFSAYIGVMPSGAILIGSLLFPLTIEYPANPMSVPVLLQFTVPWNTIAVSAYYMAALLALQRSRSTPSRSPDIILGSLSILVLFTRPSDLLPLMVLGFAYLFTRIRQKDGWKNIVAGILAGSSVLSIFLVLMLAIYGGLETPYSSLSNNIGLGFSNLPERFYAIYVDATPTWGENISIFSMQPWLYLAVPAAIIWFAIGGREALVTGLMVLTSAIVYLSYNDFAPLNVFRFQLLHYITWALPVISAAGVCGIWAITRRPELRWISLILVAASVLVAAYRVNPQALPVDSSSVSIGESGTIVSLDLGSQRNLDAIDIVGATYTDWMTLTSNNFPLSVDDEILSVFDDYRIIPYNGGVRVIFNREISGQLFSLTVSDPLVLPSQPGEVSVVPVRFGGRFTFWFWRERKMPLMAASVG